MTNQTTQRGRELELEYVTDKLSSFEKFQINALHDLVVYRMEHCWLVGRNLAEIKKDVRLTLAEAAEKIVDYRYEQLTNNTTN